MPKALFRGCRLKHFNGAPKEGGAIMRLKMEADYTEDLREEQLKSLEWTPLSDTSDEMGLIGQLCGGETFTLTPNADLVGFEIAGVPFISVSKFVAVRINEKGKEATSDVVRFEILVSGEDAMESVVSYFCNVMDEPSVLTVTYDEQQKLREAKPATESEEEPRQKSLIEIDPPESRRRATGREVH